MLQIVWTGEQKFIAPSMTQREYVTKIYNPAETWDDYEEVREWLKEARDRLRLNDLDYDPEFASFRTIQACLWIRWKIRNFQC